MGFFYRIGKIFLALTLIPRKVKIIILFLIAVSVILVLGVNFFTRPDKVAFTPFPFRDGQCLSYERKGYGTEQYIIGEKACFTKKADGFVENSGGIITTTYDSKGITRLTEEDIETWKKALNDTNHPAFIQATNESFMKKMREHSKYYGPPEARIGQLFYNNYTVTEFSEFNGEPAYVVEAYPWQDVSHADRGAISKRWWNMLSQETDQRLSQFSKFAREKNKAEQLMEKYYYSRKTGILLGSESLWVTVDKDGKVISYDSSRSDLNMVSRLIKE